MKQNMKLSMKRSVRPNMKLSTSKKILLFQKPQFDFV